MTIMKPWLPLRMCHSLLPAATARPYSGALTVSTGRLGLDRKYPSPRPSMCEYGT